MADTGIFATTSEIQSVVGANASATYNAEAHINIYIAMAENAINVATRVNWSDLYSGLNADVKSLLKEGGASLAAIYVMNADESGFPQLNEVIDRKNFLYTRFTWVIDQINDKFASDFIQEA